MGNLLSMTCGEGTRSSSPSATKCDVILSTSPQGTSTPDLPPVSPPLTPQEPPNAEGHKAVLLNVNHSLRNHLPELYRQLRVGIQFDPDLVKTILGIVDKASGGMPWPVGLAIQAVLLLCDSALQAYDNATSGDSLDSTVKELKEKLDRLMNLGVPDAHRENVKKITVELIAASIVLEDIMDRTSRQTFGSCLHAFVCAQCNATKLSNISAFLDNVLGRIRDIIMEISADRIEHPCSKVPELPSHVVGLDDPFSKVVGFLRGSGGGTQVVGLHGQGGIGKTTLMRAVEAELRRDNLQNDEGSHKIASVELGMGQPAFMDLQQSLYRQLSDGSNERFSSAAQGRGALKELMERLKGKGKKILLFLDNVWQLQHLVELLPEREVLQDVLPRGSYLLISSRSANVVEELAGMCFKTEPEQMEGYLDYPVLTLPQKDAEDLFLGKASREGEEKPPQRDDLWVQDIVHRCGGLPLALVVYGSYFRDGKRRKSDTWKKVVEQLEQAEDLPSGVDRVFLKLKHSVYFQDERLQDAFLSVAALSCQSNFFSLDAVELVMGEDLNHLVDQSLVSRVDREVKIHDLLLSVAKQMATEKRISFVTDATSRVEIDELLLSHPQGFSIRAFDEEAWHANSYPSSSQIQDVRYLKLNAGQDHSQHREFRLMITKHCHKLRMLEVDEDEDEDEDVDVDALGRAQEQLSWIANLRQLRWLSVKISSKLRVHHDFLKASSTTLRFLRIIFQGEMLLHWLGQLGSLTELYLEGCTSLVELPKELGQLGSLTGLDLEGCTSLVELPKELGQLGSLMHELGGTP